MRESNSIFGRETEIDAILSMFTQVKSGGFASIFVKGEAGVGKSHLGAYVLKQARDHGYKSVQVKYKHYSSNAITLMKEILEQLLNIALTEHKNVLASIRNRIKYLSIDVLAYIEFICPDAKYLVGQHNPKQHSNYFEHEYLSRNAFFSLLKILSDEMAPLAIHVDDFQWADETSVMIIKSMDSFVVDLNLLLMFSYRDEDTLAIRSLPTIMASIEHKKSIDLNRLSFEDSSLLIKSLYSNTINEENQVIENLYKSTMGNPYYLKQLTYSIIKQSECVDGQLVINHEMFEGIQLKQETIDALNTQIRKLNAHEKYVLRVLSCLGDQIDYQLMTNLFNTTDFDLDIVLLSLSKSGLIMKKTSVLTDHKLYYSFTHDIILDTVISTMTSEVIEDYRYALIMQLKDDESYDLFTANQIIHCKKRIRESHEQDRYINCLYLASLHVKELTLIDKAYDYLLFADELLNLNKHAIKQDIRLSIKIELAECMFITGRVAEAKSNFDYIMSNLNDVDKKLDVLIRQIMLYTSITASENILVICKEILDLLDFEVKTNMIRVRLVKEIVRFKLLFNKKRINKISNQTRSSDDRDRLVGQTLIRMIAIANLTDDNLFMYLILKLCNYSVKAGTTEYGIPSYAAGSLLFNSFLGNVELAEDLKVKTMSLINNTENDGIKCMTKFILGNFLIHWKESAIDAAGVLIESIEHGVKVGELQYAEYSYSSMVEMLYASGIPLTLLESYIDKIYEFDARIRNDIVNITIDMLKEQISYLKGVSCNRFDVESLAETDFMQTVTYNYYSLHRALFNGDYKEAYRLAEEIEPHKDIYKGYYIQVDIDFILLLTRLQVHGTSVVKNTSKNLKNLKKLYKQMGYFSRNFNENHHSRYLIAKAKYEEKITGVFADELYDEGIKLALSLNQHMVAAIGKLMQASSYENKHKIRDLYLKESVQYFDEWGANSIADQIITRYNLRVDRLIEEDADNEIVIEDVVKPGHPIAIDVKEFELVAEDDSLSYILRKLLHNMADVYGAVFLQKDDDIFLSHEYKQGEINQLNTLSNLDSINHVSKKVVRYLFRTKKDIFIQSKLENSFFNHDKYLNDKDAYSILCMPLMFSNVLSGVIYIVADKDFGLESSLIEAIRYYSSMLTAKSLSANQKEKVKVEIPLTKRELDVFLHIIKGQTNKEVGDSLNISVSTVKTHLINIYSKLEIKSRIEAIEKAVEYGLY